MLKLWQSRKKTFVNARIQGRILGRIAAYWVLYHFVLWNGLFVFRYAQYRSAITSGAETVPFRELYRQFCVDFYPLVVCAAVILPAFMIDFVSMTHRIAGPLIRFRNALRDLRAGKRIERVGMRKRDMLNEFQNEFNEFLKFYNARLDAAEAAAGTGAADRMSEEDALTVDELASEADAAEHGELGKTAVMIN